MPTPYLCVDLDILDANIAAMAALARDRGLALRPHVKTHKSPALARRQLAAGAVGITVATVSEAETFVDAAFADAGCADVFIAYPLWVDDARGARLVELARRCSLRVGVDSVQGAQALARYVSVEVLVEIDSGHHRTGVTPDAAGDVAVAAARAGLRVRGVFTFPGHGYGPGAAAPAAADEVRSLHRAAAVVRGVGVPVDVVSGGSTPTAGHTPARPPPSGPPPSGLPPSGSLPSGPLTELRPGVYVFGDAQQVEMGTCGFADVALTAVATVVSRGPGRVVLDAGSKVLGADRPPWTTGFGRLLDHPGARLTALSEHHATVAWPGGSAVPELGASVRVVPNHVCNAVNLADELVVVSRGAVVDRWPVAARGANT